ncbi:hypothetical protein ACFPRL_06710 [Pseudoclavibacter helvolus]
MWFGITRTGLSMRPMRRISITPMIISAVLPAPTSWNSPAEGSAIMRATAERWCGRGVKFSASPGRLRYSPAFV